MQMSVETCSNLSRSRFLISSRRSRTFSSCWRSRRDWRKFSIALGKSACDIRSRQLHCKKCEQ